MIPVEHRWLFWDVDPDGLDPARHGRYIIPRVLEHGRLRDVKWLLRTYGTDEIHRFLKDVGDPALSARTLAFWRIYLHAKDEPWTEPPDWRTNNAVPWPL